MSDFLHPALKELTDQQVRFAPPPRRREQVARAQLLLLEVDPERRYPYQFVCFKITDFRSDANSDLVIRGDELKLDLLRFIRQLERSIPPLPIEQELEPMLVLEEISKQFNVSTKTIGRWRVRGLVGRHVIVNGRRQLAFAKSVVERFVATNQDRVERSARFSHLSIEEREEILRRASRLARAGGSLTEVSRRIARKLKRSVETVRYTIKNFDRDCPELAIFPDTTGPLDGDTKELIVNSYKQRKGTPMDTLTKTYNRARAKSKGIPVETLAKTFNRARSTVYRVVNEDRAQKVLQKKLDYMHHESFDDPAVEESYLAPMPGEADFVAAHENMKPPRDVPPELASLYEWPLLTKEQEQHMFRQMNYLKHMLHQLKAGINPGSARAADLKKMDELQARIKWTRDRLINCNMRLVASIAKQHAGQTENLFDLISDGNESLMRAVEKFNYAFGNKFSTYATWAIRKNFARSIPNEKHHRERYLTGHEEMFEARPDARSDEQECLQQADQARDKISRLLEGLDPRTRDVIKMRNGLDGSAEMTLEQIGQHFGITKERVRQINVRGMKILRERATQAKVDLQ